MKNPLWRQSTPVDQLIAITGAIDGHFSNFEEKIIDREHLIDETTLLLRQLEELVPFLQDPSKWEISKKNWFLRLLAKLRVVGSD